MRSHSLTCTFCRKSEHQVRKLVSGPGVYICDQCVETAHRIVKSEEGPSVPQSFLRRLAARIRSSFETLDFARRLTSR